MDNAMSQGTVSISGNIKNYDPNSSITKSIDFWTDDLFSGEKITSTAEIKIDGSFDVLVPQYQPMYFIFLYQKELYTAYAKPGDSLSIILDDLAPSKSILFEGDGAYFNNFYSQFNLELDRQNSHHQKYEEVRNNPELAKQWYLNSLSKSLEFLEKFSAKNKLDQSYKERIKAKLEFSIAYALISEGNLEEIFNLFPITSSEASFSGISVEYLKQYYNYLLQMIDQPQIDYIPSPKEVATVLLAYIDELSDTDKAILIKFSTLKDYDSALDQNDTIKLREIVQNNWDLFEEKFPPKHPLVEYFLTETEGPARDVFLSWMLCGFIKGDYLEVVKPYLDIYNSVVTNEILKNSLVRYYKEQEKERYLNASEQLLGINFREVPKANVNSFFSEILESHRGKVVYIDFWGTWCAPCLAEMPASRKLKEELDGQNVVFIYLGVTSVESTWKRMVAKLGIRGEHYLLDGAEFLLLQEQYQIQMVPRYMLVDKNGEIYDRDAMRPSDPNLKGLITKLAEI